MCGWSAGIARCAASHASGSEAVRSSSAGSAAGRAGPVCPWRSDVRGRAATGGGVGGEDGAGALAAEKHGESLGTARCA